MVAKQGDDEGHTKEEIQHAHNEETTEDAVDKVTQLVGTIVASLEAQTEVRPQDTYAPN